MNVANAIIKPSGPAGTLRHLGSFVAGFVFSVGLGVGGMTQPAKVVGFLDVFGRWDPSLLGVMGGAVVVNAILHLIVTKKLRRPLFEEKFSFPTRRDVDSRLLLGSAIFGVGWGLGGFCPGPGLTALVTGNLTPIVFVGAMVLGMLAERYFTEKVATR